MLYRSISKSKPIYIYISMYIYIYIEIVYQIVIKHICSRGAEKLEAGNAARIAGQPTWQTSFLAPTHWRFQTYQPAEELKASGGDKTLFLQCFLIQP